MNLASPHHYVMTDIVSLCGLSAVYAVWKQPKDELGSSWFPINGIVGERIGCDCVFDDFLRQSNTKFRAI